MQKITAKDGQSANIIKENIAQLKALFPDVITENGVDFDTLRQLLGDAQELDQGEEKYGLSWHGKKRALQIALTPSLGTLLPCQSESVEWSKSKNIFIEGDNLEVLKLLQKSYAGKIKLIYIDPPYNTGKEFVYPDNYHDDLDTYLKYTGQKDSSGMSFSTNKETSGRKHTNWLNMMYSRLRLARDLLAKDGIVAISIDENEHANLVKLGELVFGAENFAGDVIWKNSSKNDQDYVSMQHEYVVIFVKNKSENKGQWLEKKEGLDQIYKAFEGFRAQFDGDEDKIHEAALEWYRQFPDSNPIKDSKHYSWMDERGVYFASDLSGPNDGQYVFDLLHPTTKKACKMPASGWRYPEETLLQRVKEGRVQFGPDHTTVPKNKTYLKDTEFQSLTSVKIKDGRAASKRLENLFGSKVFNNPKDEYLLKDFMKAFGLKDDDIVLDFFAGSCSSAHAVIELNRETGSNCRYIAVQLPEDLSAMESSASGSAKKIAKNAISYLKKKGRPQNIAEIGKERLRLVAERYAAEQTLDAGFRAFRLATSNIKAWSPDRKDLEATLLAYTDHLTEGRSQDDLLHELLLKRGIDLAVDTKTKQVAGKSIHSVGSGVLFACLDDSIAAVEVEDVAHGILAWHKELAPETDSHVFFRDSAFADDIAKTNMAAILEQNGISHVRSL
jgi:adenine-specific DNA-methyltransferase